MALYGIDSTDYGVKCAISLFAVLVPLSLLPYHLPTHPPLLTLSPAPPPPPPPLHHTHRNHLFPPSRSQFLPTHSVYKWCHPIVQLLYLFCRYIRVPTFLSQVALFVWCVRFVCSFLVLFLFLHIMLMINPWHACAARVTVVCWPDFCLCVCLLPR